MPATLQLALYKGRTRLFDRAVQWWTRSTYSHCELMFSTDLTTGLSVCASSSYLDGGVRVKTMALDHAKWDVLSLPGFDAAAASDWFAARAGQRYDVLGLLGFVLPPVADNKVKWFCSEACAAALGLGDPWRFSPGVLAVVARDMGRWTGRPVQA